MNERKINTIIPSIDQQGKIKLPLMWDHNGTKIVCCITLSKSEALELGERLKKLGEDHGNNQG